MYYDGCNTYTTKNIYSHLDRLKLKRIEVV